MDLTVLQAIDEIAYGAQCPSCCDIVRIDLHGLAMRFGAGMLVSDIRPRLRCSKCGARNPIICTLWLSAGQTEMAVSGGSSPYSQRRQDRRD